MTHYLPHLVITPRGIRFELEAHLAPVLLEAHYLILGSERTVVGRKSLLLTRNLGRARIRLPDDLNSHISCLNKVGFDNCHSQSLINGLISDDRRDIGRYEK